ncbi:MAG: cytochrome c oxidase assembly protein, partial [Gammaproteobacteria bacterium]|nr:cytochrome c oxidase assembly protein [Gammaproteobacteria bacterium]
MSENLERANRRLTLRLLGVALGAFAFGFALVPLYDVLCDLTGVGNQKNLLKASTILEKPDDARTVTVEFIADLPSVGNWEFAPVVNSMQVHPGR